MPRPVDGEERKMQQGDEDEATTRMSYAKNKADKRTSEHSKALGKAPRGEKLLYYFVEGTFLWSQFKT